MSRLSRFHRLTMALSLVAVTSCGSSAKTSTTTKASTAATTVAAPATTTATTTAAPAKTTAAPAGSGTDCAAAKGAVIGYSEPLPDPNFAILETVIKADLAKAGATLEAANANIDPGKQIADIDGLLQKNIKALLINPVEPNAVKPGLDRVRAKNVPIIVQETQIGGPYYTNVTSDVEQAAADGAAYLKEQVKDGKVGGIDGPPIAEILKRQSDGFTAKSKEIGLTVVDRQTNFFNNQITPDGGRQIADQWKQRFADMKGIWTFNDTTALGVAGAVDGTWKPVIASINGQPEIIPLVKEGKVAVTYDLELVKVGHTLAFAALSAICGQKLPANIYLPMKRIDKSNVDQWKSPADVMKEPFTVKLIDKGGKSYVDMTGKS